jgi:hypothetical protein
MRPKSGIPTALATVAIVAVFGLVMDSALAAQTRAVTGAPGSGRLSNADERRFSALTFEHRTVRGRLPPAERTDLDRLTAHVRDVLFAPAPRATAWEDAKAAVRGIIPGLADNDTAVLAAYALDSILAGDLEVLRFAKSEPPFEALVGFKPQYLQLQSQMPRQNAGQWEQMISNVMKAEAVKSGISKLW